MTSEYDGSNIRVLEGLEGVRIRPGMYIGSTGSRGLHHLVYEVVDNSIEEALAGHCLNIDISINADGSITVIDDGRGIESEIDSQTGKFSIEEIFTTLHLGKFRELAGVHAGMRISFADYRLQALEINEPKLESYYYEGGLRDYLAYLNREKQPLHEDVIYAKTEKDRIRVEVALQWCDADVDNVIGFANTVQTMEGGQHCDGLKMAVTRTVNKIAHQQNRLQSDDDNLGGEYIREGLTAVVSVLLPNPEWAGPIKAKLANSEARGIVDSIVSEVLSEHFAARPDLADAIIERAIKASDADRIRKRERDLLRRKSKENDLHPS